MIPTLPRLGDLKLLELVIDRVERDEELMLLRLLMLGELRTEDADGALVTVCLLALDLELLLLRLLCAKTGSPTKISAETSMTRAAFNCCRYLNVNMICLLSSLLAITRISAILLPFRGTNSGWSNEISHSKMPFLTKK